jgi:hypothetical protein
LEAVTRNLYLRKGDFQRKGKINNGEQSGGIQYHVFEEPEKIVNSKF